MVKQDKKLVLTSVILVILALFIISRYSYGEITGAVIVSPDIIALKYVFLGILAYGLIVYRSGHGKKKKNIDKEFEIEHLEYCKRGASLDEIDDLWTEYDEKGSKRAKALNDLSKGAKRKAVGYYERADHIQEVTKMEKKGYEIGYIAHAFFKHLFDHKIIKNSKDREKIKRILGKKYI